MARKFIVLLLALLVIFPLLSLPVSANTSSLSSGTLIKSTTYPDVYYLGADGKRYVFPDQKTYQTWYISFKGIISISQTELTRLPLGGTVTYKPGSRLLKMKTDPKVYYVDINATLRYVPSESLAKELWGNDWAQLVNDISESYYPLYKEGTPLASNNLTPISSEYSINQEKKLSNEPNPVSNKEIILTKSVSGQNVNLNWETNFTSAQGFKIVKADHVNPVYPGDDYHYLSSPSVRADIWEGLSAGTYHFRVCEYLGGSCGAYSNDVTVTISGTNFTKKIILSAAVSGNAVNLNWTINFSSLQGYKIVYSTSVNPVYPGNDYHYITDYTDVTDSWTLTPGTYHFRVCEYLGGSCGVYSNDVPVTISGTNFTKEIILSAAVSGNQVNLNWTINFSSLQGYKIVYSTSVNPVYPGNDYHYITDYTDVTDSWTLTPGTYHFRVCEYLGGSCGVYSNDVPVTISGTNFTKEIILSAAVSGNQVNLNWTINFSSLQGYKIVYSTSVNPVYPGNDYHYITDYTDVTDSWTLTPGTYHFRVCEYLGGSCGTYSNDVPVTVQ